MSHSDTRIRFADYLTIHHPNLVQEFCTTGLPPQEMELWAAFKLTVDLDHDGCMVGACDVAFVDDTDPDVTGLEHGATTSVTAESWSSRMVKGALLLPVAAASLLFRKYRALKRYAIPRWEWMLVTLELAHDSTVLYLTDVFIWNEAIAIPRAQRIKRVHRSRPGRQSM